MTEMILIVFKMREEGGAEVSAVKTAMRTISFDNEHLGYARLNPPIRPQTAFPVHLDRSLGAPKDCHSSSQPDTISPAG